MKRALLVGVTNEEPDHPLQPEPSVAAMAALLEELGGWSIVSRVGQKASREGVRQALEEWSAVCGPDDTCLFYFFGHGGVVRFRDLPGALGARPVFYLATSRAPGPWSFMGLMDFELSSALSRLDLVCENVTVILDCCHAASMVREPGIPTIDPPAWLASLAKDDTDRDRLLAAEGHPRIVRLAASSSLRSAYPRRHAGGVMGMLTGVFIDVLRSAELRCDSIAWDGLAHRVREQVSQEHGTEDQRVVLAGPRERLVFSRRTVELPRGACFVPSDDEGKGWLRAGILQGVEVGDRWEITDLQLDEELAPRIVGEAEVHRVQLDRSEVMFMSLAGESIPAGSSALLRRSERRYPVSVAASSLAAEIVGDSSLLRLSSEDEAEVIVRCDAASDSSPATLVLVDRSGEAFYGPIDHDRAGTTAVVSLLEDRARAQRLLESLERHSPTSDHDAPLDWSWARQEADGGFVELLCSQWGESPPRLRVGDHVRIQVSHRGDRPPPWFVCAIGIGIDGRPSLINTNEPEGVEVIPNEVVYIADRGHRRRRGIQLTWPEGVARDRVRAATLVLLASRRPISLGNLVRTPSPDALSAFRAQGLIDDEAVSYRGGRVKRPVLSLGWTWKRIDFVLDPCPRS